MAKYDTYSLREIKAAMRDAHARIDEMSRLYSTYADAANFLDVVAADMHGARGVVREGWQGSAGDAAGTALGHVATNAHHSRGSSARMGHLTDGLANSTQNHYEQVEGTPDVDTAYAASLQSNYMNPYLAVHDHQARVAQAANNQRAAAAQARALDTAGQDWQHKMTATDWPSHQAAVAAPPRRLPTRTTTHPPIAPIGPTPPPGPPGPRGPVPPVVPPGSPRGTDPTGGGVTTPTGVGGAYGGVGPWTGSGSAATSPAVTLPDAPGLGTGLGAGLAGGLAGGALGDLAGAGGEAGTGGAAGAAEGDALEGRARTAGLGAVADEAGGERGLLGAPMGGAGRRKDDEERRRPDYLEETDDVWGSGDYGVPPVLGEQS